MTPSFDNDVPIVATGGFDGVIGNPPWERIQLVRAKYDAYTR